MCDKLLDFQRDASEFEISKEEIGRGRYSHVYLGVEIHGNKEQLAFKRIDLGTTPKKAEDRDDELGTYIRREIQILESLTHPFCLKFHGFILEREKNRLFIISNYYPNGTLENALMKFHENQPLPEFTPTKMTCSIYGICRIMSYVHSKNVIHRDLKPANIYLDENFNVIIGDFGLSRVPDPSNQHTKNIGTPLYTAPEIFSSVSDEDYGNMVDVFSFGVILYGYYFAFKKNNRIFFPTIILKNGQTVRQVNARNLPGLRKKEGIFEKQSNIPDAIWNDIILNCFNPNPNERPTFAKLADTIESNSQYWFENTNENEFKKYVNMMKNLRFDQ